MMANIFLMICLIFRKNLRQKIVSQNLRLRMFLAMFSFSLGYFSLNVLIKNVLNKKKCSIFFYHLQTGRLFGLLEEWQTFWPLGHRDLSKITTRQTSQMADCEIKNKSQYWLWSMLKMLKMRRQNRSMERRRDRWIEQRMEGQMDWWT